MMSRAFLLARWSCGLVFISSALVCSGTPGSDANNPYTVIVERNVFHLNPLPPPPEPEKPKVELPTVKITGFVNIGNQSKVLFMAHSKENKDPIYYSLSEGERSANGKLELVKIYPSHDLVDVLNDGVAVTLSVKEDSLAANEGGPPAGAPAASVPPGVAPPGSHPLRPMFPGRPTPPGAGNSAFGAGGPLPMRMRRSLPQ